MTFEWKKYILVFLLTLGIFGVAFLFSEYLFNQRTAQIKTIESTISQSIIESEIQYTLLADAVCEENGSSAASTIILDQLNSLATRLEYLEQQRGSDDTEVIALKKQYSLLEIKDYLLLREQTKQCGKKFSSILYFYTNDPSCTDCKKMGYVLTGMRKDYDTLHIYSFDYNLELSVIATLKSIYRLEENFPIVVIDRKPYYGYKTREELEALLPDLEVIASTTATTTKATRKK